uniref:Synaptobrevin, longin-like domain protein n=1 Tax=Tanacetum cinerariifolium TaxID=118510 RepID=A0A6L2J9N6_TANCI|nr:hypothetical protein [Tanacetum cinerariifolium]
MALTFSDTHNMIAYLTKSYASEGFDQILDILNASSIQYALTVNPNIYVYCIKQFWSAVLVKKTNDVVRFQALIDRKKVIITEDTVRQALRLNDAESIDCLPNEEIFIDLARMGYEKPSTKLIFYKAFFSAQWKFLIHTILQCMSAKRIAWNKFSSSMASAIICLATGRKFNFSKYIFDSLVRNVDNSSKFYMYPRFLQLIIRAQVGDISSHTTKYSSPVLTQKQVADDVTAIVTDDDVPADDAEPTPPLPIPATTPPPPQELPSKSQEDASKHGGIIELIDADKDVTLEEVDVAKDAEVKKNVEVDEQDPTELKEVIEVVTTAKLMIEVVTAAATRITDAPITAARSVARRRKGETINRSPDQKEYDGLSKKIAGFKMDFFRGMGYDDIRPIFEKYINLNVAFLDKSKEQLEEEESRALKRQSESSEYLSLEESKSHSWFSKSQKLEIVRVLWSAYHNIHHNIHYYTDDLDGREKISLDKVHLDQMLNNVRLEVEEESEVSLELLRFTYKCWCKLMLLDNVVDSRLRLLEQSDAVDEKMKK